MGDHDRAEGCDEGSRDLLGLRLHAREELLGGLDVCCGRGGPTPLDPEDIYELSERLDQVIGAAKDLVREAEALSLTPDPALAAMASLTVQGVDDLAEGFAALPKK